MPYTYTSRVQGMAERNLKAIEDSCGSLAFNKVILFLNHGCNLRCRGCYVKAERSKGDFLPFDEMLRAMQYGRAKGARYLVIPGYGEPLMDPDFWRLIELARELDLDPVVYTNATLVDAAAANRLKALQVMVIAKRNSFNGSLQDEIVGTEGASVLMDKGVKNLLAAGFKSPRLALESYITRSLLDGLKNVLRFCRKNNLLPYFEAFENSAPEIVAQIEGPLISDEELTAFFDELAEIDQREFGLVVAIPDGSRIYCFGPGVQATSPIFQVGQNTCCDRSFTSFCISHMGDVRFCVDHRKTVGNIREASIEDILNPAKNARLRMVFPTPCSYQTARYRESLAKRGGR